jgi:hypothetical protein
VAASGYDAAKGACGKRAPDREGSNQRTQGALPAARGRGSGGCALLPTSAGAHPEECSTGGVFGSPSADWLAEWTADSECCMSAAAANGFDDSGAQLGPDDSEGTDTLTLLSNAPKPPPFETESDFNSDIAFENGYAFVGNFDGVRIWDVDAGARGVHPLPGLAERRHGQRRDRRHVDRLAPHQRHVPERVDDLPVRRHVEHRSRPDLDCRDPEAQPGQRAPVRHPERAEAGALLDVRPGPGPTLGPRPRRPSPSARGSSPRSRA